MSKAADDLLRTYREKRDFSLSSEPSGEAPPSPRDVDGLYFCVQKHDATRLHYDFRIEWEGVLKSWAVTRGPSLDPSEKRLAVRTEDHPLDYGSFEGTIPEKQYGAGTVMLWDRGTWQPVGDAAEGLRKGELKMQLHGERMEGRWVLVRMKPREREKRENWLLIKENDDAVDRQRDLLKADRSVLSNRTMEEIAQGGVSLPDHARDAPQDAEASTVRKGPGPSFRDLQLATLVDKAPDGEQWLHEVKYDGYRALVAVGAGGGRCYSRSGEDWTERFAPIARAAETLACDTALLDGEIVAFDANGKTDFSTLQKHLSEGGPLTCFLFDCLHLDGEDLTERPLVERKARLAELLRETGSEILLYSDHVTGNGPAVEAELCRHGQEGIVSKRADAPYSGGRSRNWQKAKCTRRQEFVIGGWSPSDKTSRPFSSLLVGVFEGGKLHYRGRVGAGFEAKSLQALRETFDRTVRKTSPFVGLPRDVTRKARFIEPRLVAEIDFAELTAQGQIRHGVFKGLREDKEAGEVSDERPVKATRRSERASGTPRAASRTEEAASQGPDRIAGVRLTNPDRVIFPSQGLTKGELAAYYEAVSERMLVHAGDRPLSLVRCPQGAAKHCFFQKHAGEGFPDTVGGVAVKEKDGSTVDYITVSDAAGLVGAVQMGTLEFHIWGARNDRLDRPDRCVFDLDPAEGLDFADVRQAAFDLAARLQELGLQSFPLATGGKGLHLVLPLERRQDFETLKAFAAGFARKVAAEEPDRFLAKMSKAARKGRIFIDWLRNQRGQTAVAPYSTRSRTGAPVAAPLAWSEVETLEAANIFNVPKMLKRIEQDDPWSGYADVRQSLTKSILSKLED